VCWVLPTTARPANRTHLTHPGGLRLRLPLEGLGLQDRDERVVGSPPSGEPCVRGTACVLRCHMRLLPVTQKSSLSSGACAVSHASPVSFELRAFHCKFFSGCGCVCDEDFV
jgi:hypothetical protein